MPEGPPDGSPQETYLAVVRGGEVSLNSPEASSPMSPPNVTLLFQDEAASSAPSSVCKFGAAVAIRLPGDALRHPRLTDQLRHEIGRICAVDLQHDGVRVGFGVRGATFEDATGDAGAVVEHLLGWLGLSPAAVVEQGVFERDLGLLTPAEHGLRAVPDLR